MSSCRFEFTDARADEVVKMRIISVLRLAVCGPAGFLLDDDSVWHIVQDCFVHRNQVREGQGHRRIIEMSQLRESSRVESSRAGWAGCAPLFQSLRQPLSEVLSSTNLI